MFDKLRKNDSDAFLVISIISFISIILYDLGDFLTEFQITYESNGIFLLFLSLVFHLFFLFFPFFVGYLLIISVLDLAIIKKISWSFFKDKYNDQEIANRKDEHDDNRFSTFLLGLTITIFSVLLWCVYDETLLSIIYPLEINNIIDNIIDTPCLFCRPDYM